MANGRKNRNFIPSISHNGAAFIDLKDIGKIFLGRFQQQFGQKRASHFKIDFHKLLTNKLQVDLSQLQWAFSLDEIKVAVFELGRDKAPGANGFSLWFFCQFWKTTKLDLLQLCENFFFRRANLERINWASIALIPKVEMLEYPGDYQPISLINSSLKILSKIVASRLSRVINSLVDTDKVAF